MIIFQNFKKSIGKSGYFYNKSMNLGAILFLRAFQPSLTLIAVQVSTPLNQHGNFGLPIPARIYFSIRFTSTVMAFSICSRLAHSVRE